MGDDRLIELIRKELTETLENTETSELASLLETEKNKALYNSLHKAWQNMGNFEADFHPNSEAAWAATKEKLNDTDEPLTQPKVVQMPTWMKIAASLALLVTVAFLVYKFGFTGEQTTYATGDNETKMIALLDGTEIWLNENSTLSQSADYNENNREVHLIGEAFFDVARNEEKPFIISTSKTRTQVFRYLI